MGDASDPTILAGRYQLVRCLGSGTSCDVYEAIDLALGARVALKRFREDSVDASVHTRREFRTLARIHVPGLVRFFDLIVTDDATFFTMELVDGVTLTEYARQASPDQLRTVLGRVARVLGELHALGQLHRDVKPTNIMITRDGHVRVLDFGLASATGAAAGTPAYLAPELLLGGQPSAASDWYSFGAVVYEVLAHQVPTSGRELAELVMRKQQRRFQAVRAANPAAPADLAELAWGLLDPDPRTRLGPAAVAAAFGVRAPEAAPRSALFGRGAELAALAGALADARDGHPTVVIVEGDSGAGKSSLVRAFLAGEPAATCFVLASAARPQESVPLRAIDAMVDELAQVIERLPATARAALDPAITRPLVRAFPVLGRVTPARTAGDPGGDAVEARRDAQLAFARVLRELAAIRPVVLWIDDVQWADYESTLFLEAAVARAGAAPLCVILARRPIPLPWPDRESWLDAATPIALGPLDDDAARALLGARAARTARAVHAPDASDSGLATDAAHATSSAHTAMPETVIAAAMREARGNAFLLEFLAHHALRGERRLSIDREPGDRGFGIDAALRAALDGLDADARILFECVSLAHHPVPLAHLGRVLPDRAQLRDHTARLSLESLISVDERDRVRPYHDALRERAAAALDPPTRRARHALLAGAFRDADAPIEWQIPHLEGSGQGAAAGDACIRAGRAAAERYAYEIAALYFEKALGLADLIPRARGELLEALAHNLAAAGNGRVAAGHYERAAEVFRTVADPRAALSVQHKAAIALLRAGEIAGGRAALKTALHGLGERLPRMALLASLYEAVRLEMALRRPVRPTAPAAPAAADRELLASPVELRLDTLWTSANTLSMYEPLVAQALALRFVRRALAVGEPSWVVRALALHAAFLAALGGRWRPRAERTMVELRRLAAATIPPYETAWVAATEGSTAWFSGDILRCYEWTTRARELFRSAPETGAYDIALLDFFRLPAMALLGHHYAVLQNAEEILAIARARGDGFATLPCLHGHITLAYLAAGQLDRAAVRADEANAIAHLTSSPTPAYHQTWSRATLALFIGDGERAYDVVLAAWSVLRRTRMLGLEAVAGDLRYLRARCALSAARARSGPPRARHLRDARAQARWLRRSTLAHGAATADAIDAQVAALDGGERDAPALAATASAALHHLGLAPDADALDRWSNGRALLPIDHIYVG